MLVSTVVPADPVVVAVRALLPQLELPVLVAPSADAEAEIGRSRAVCLHDEIAAGVQGGRRAREIRVDVVDQITHRCGRATGTDTLTAIAVAVHAFQGDGVAVDIGGDVAAETVERGGEHGRRAPAVVKALAEVKV